MSVGSMTVGEKEGRMNRRSTARALCIALLVLVVGFGFAEEREGIYVEFDPRIIGADVRLGYRVPLVSKRLTAVSAMVGGAWGGEAYYRFPDDSPYPPGAPYEAATFNRVNLIWDVGVEQDLSANPTTLVSPFVFYRGMRNVPLDDVEEDELFLASPRSDAAGILTNELLVGAYFDAVRENDTFATQTGFYGEASAAVAPRGLANDVVGESDYTRMNLTLKGFLPLAEVGSHDDPILGAYLAGFLSVDSVLGSAIPHSVRSTFGGLDQRWGLGGAVRGVDKQRFDSSFKAVANLEARFAFPGVLDPWIVPGIVTYVDAGYYLDTEELAPDSEGVAVTSGVGLSVDALGIATLVFYTQYYLNGNTVRRDSPWTPFALGFGLHF